MKMDSYILIIILIIVILTFELCKCYSKNTCESFSASRTNIIYSNYENESSLQVYAKVNEEILILEQEFGKVRVMKFKYLRAPLQSWIAVYVRKAQEDGQVTINTELIEITSPVIDLIETLGQNGVFINDNKTIRYYIKALNDTTYKIEKANVDKIKSVRFRYNNCIKSKNDVSSNMAIQFCKKEFGL